MNAAETLTVVSEAATEEFVVASPGMSSVYEFVKKVASRNIPVLIHGETGVGKEHVARSLHDHAGRRGRFVAVNCAAIPPQLMESVLFGHEKGAFTSADRQTQGLFEQADGGTLFLDEIGELSARAQAALLRVLQEKRLSRVGSNHELSVDFRVVAATHRDLTAMVSAKTFRDDLFYRVSVAEIFVPPLRERREEIPLLASSFLRRATSAAGGERCFFGEPAMAMLLGFAWPGNVRQLWNVVQFASVARGGPQIRPEDFPEEVRAETASRVAMDSVECLAGACSPQASDVISLRRRVQDFEAALIREVLDRTGWRITETARLLSIPVRTLNNKMLAHGIRRRSEDDGALPVCSATRPVTCSPSTH